MARIKGIEAELFPLNLGTNTFGWTSDAKASEAVLDAFVAAGGNFVDTADSYSFWAPGNVGGESETILGAWMTSRKSRARTVVATKVGGLPERKGLAPAVVRAALEDSLRRLGTDYVDLYYAHHDEPTVPIEDLAVTFDALVREGKVRAIGISNLAPARIRGWLDFAKANGLTIPAALQPEYNLVHRATFEQSYGPLAREHGLAVLPYYSLASGFLTGKYRTAADLEGAPRGGSTKKYLGADGLGVVAALSAVADAHAARPATVALAWLLAKGVTAPIASVSRVEQLPDLMASASLKLTADEVAALDTASAPFA